MPARLLLGISGADRNTAVKAASIADVAARAAGDVDHTLGGPLLARLAGVREVMVNSLHGQGIRKLAAGVTVEAAADDGLIEAFTVDEAEAFALAVQWHPEWKAKSNEFSSAIFRAFGDACRERASRKRV